MEFNNFMTTQPLVPEEQQSSNLDLEQKDLKVETREDDTKGNLDEIIQRNGGCTLNISRENVDNFYFSPHYGHLRSNQHEQQDEVGSY